MSKIKYKDLEFPGDFIWGSATSSHQVEGNNKNNNWWVWEQKSGNTIDGSISGKACDQYNQYKEDIQLIKKLGHQCYRFSLEWSRIEPEKGKFDSKEIRHYRDLINELIDNNIIPMVTLHHFTTPIWLQNIGAWENSEIIDLFERYTIYIAEELGDLIPFWNTINEPMIVALLGYLIGIHPPNKRDRLIFYKVALNLLKSHAKAYHAIHRTVKSVSIPFVKFSRPQVGIVKNLIAYEPVDFKSESDKKETIYRSQTSNWWFLDAIDTGVIGLPFGNNEYLEYLKNSSDFIGFNYYTRGLTSKSASNEEISGPLEKTDMGWEIYPEGLYYLLMKLNKYKKPIIITENGIATTHDERRCKYILQHLREIHRGIQQGLDIRGYLYWTTLDNFEWVEGFTKRFGLIEVNFDTMERKPRPSAYLFQKIIQQNKITIQMQEKYQI
jgi:beta-glucosidase